MSTATRRRPPARRTRWCDERGAVGGLEALPFGLLVFVVGTLLVANAWAAVDAKSAATAAAREAARSYVEAPDRVTADRAALAAATAAARGHGRADTLEVERVGGTFRRCAQVTFEAHLAVPVVVVPWVGGLRGPTIDVTARHAEVVDPYRSGVPGEVRCE